jgi:hypothetical protein
MLFSRSRAFDNLQALFAEQFEPDGDLHYLYRRGSRGAPVRVTAAERDAFVADYRRRWRGLKWSMIGTVMLVALGFGLANVGTQGERSDWYLEGAVALVVLLFLIVHRRLWTAPARALELERRPELGRERSRAEMRQRMAARLSWPQILSFLLIVPLAGLQYGEAAARGSTIRWLWLAFLPLGPATAAIVAWRKWRLGRER